MSSGIALPVIAGGCPFMLYLVTFSLLCLSTESDLQQFPDHLVIFLQTKWSVHAIVVAVSCATLYKEQAEA